jgi:RsiW-degrading membrane proteinase PrsW (M82 family)
MKDKYFSVDHEPALSGAPGKNEPAEGEAAPGAQPDSDLEALRDSIASEPALPQHADPEQWARWLDEKRRRCTVSGNLGVTLLAAVLGGPFAVLGALLSSGSGMIGILYPIVFAPVIEELLKQSGMTYVLERKPYRVFSAWQFVFAALVSGLVFGAIENLVYMVQFAAFLDAEQVWRLTAFRWAVCTPLHAVWAAIASLGLVRVWKKHVHRGRPADLSAAVPWFVIAMALHGLYNLWATFLGP